jgi:NmrA-like family
LLAEGKQIVTAITRADSEGSVPASVVAKKVDYSSHSSLVEALKGQDALIITLSVMAPRDQQSKLIEAAAEAGVPWIMPNEWGSDTAHPVLLRNPTNAGKTAAYSQIEKLGKSNYIAFVNNQWWEWSLGGGYYGIDIPNRKAKLWDDGTAKTVTTTWPRVGEAVAKLLALPVSGGSQCLNDFKNKHVYASSFYLSQREMLDAVQRSTGTTDQDWEITNEPAVAAYENALEEFKKGNYGSVQTIIYAGNFVPGGGNDYVNTKDTLNKLLNLPQEDLDEATKRAVEYSREHKAMH